MEIVNLKLPLSVDSLEKLKDINDNYKMIINFDNDMLLNEKAYYNNIRELFEILKNHDKNYDLMFYVQNRKIFSDSKILENKYENLNITINNEGDNYTFSKYKDNDKTLDNLIKKIKTEKLSPLERFTYVYNVVRKYAEYRENSEDENVKQAKTSKYKSLLDNDYIVCKEYNSLLTVLLNKVGLASLYIKGKNNCLNEKEIFEITSKNLVKIDDDKYNVHGIYVNDIKLENIDISNKFTFALMTFDKIKKIEKLESPTLIDCLFDFRNKGEFYAKINYLIKYYSNKFDTANGIIKTIYNLILVYLYRLDYKEYTYLYKKYNLLNYDEVNNLQKVFEQMLEDYYEYVSKYVNKEIVVESIKNAYFNAKVILKKDNKNLVKDEKKINENVKNAENYYFPFVNDSDEEIKKSKRGR